MSKVLSCVVDFKTRHWVKRDETAFAEISALLPVCLRLLLRPPSISRTGSCGSVSLRGPDSRPRLHMVRLKMGWPRLGLVDQYIHRAGSFMTPVRKTRPKKFFSSTAFVFFQRKALACGFACMSICRDAKMKMSSSQYIASWHELVWGLSTNLTDAELCIKVGLFCSVLQDGVGHQQLKEVSWVGVLWHLGSFILQAWSDCKWELLGHKEVPIHIPWTIILSLLACKIIYKNTNRTHNYS